MSYYEKLGKLLNQALDENKIPQNRNNKKQEEKLFSNNNEQSNQNENIFEFKNNETNNEQKTKKRKLKSRKENKGKNFKTNKTNNNENSDGQRNLIYAEYFSTLGLSTEASKESVKSAYRRLIKKYHPDNVPKLPIMQKTAAAKTVKIVEAYKILLDFFKHNL